MKTSLKVSVCNFCGCSNSNSFITPGQRGERLENLPCLGLYFQTTHIFLTGFLLWAHWYKCWRSIQICFLLVTHGQNPKRAAIPKAKDSTAHGYLTGYYAQMHQWNCTVQGKLLHSYNCFCMGINLMHGGLESSWY